MGLLTSNATKHINRAIMVIWMAEMWGGWERGERGGGRRRRRTGIRGGAGNWTTER